MSVEPHSIANEFTQAEVLTAQEFQIDLNKLAFARFRLKDAFRKGNPGPGQLITERQNQVAAIGQNFLTATDIILEQRGWSSNPAEILTNNVYGLNDLAYGLTRAAQCGQTLGEYLSDPSQYHGNESQSPNPSADPRVVLYIKTFPLISAQPGDNDNWMRAVQLTDEVVDQYAHRLKFYPPEQSIVSLKSKLLAADFDPKMPRLPLHNGVVWTIPNHESKQSLHLAVTDQLGLPIVGLGISI